jgi:hypothetical protein
MSRVERLHPGRIGVISVIGAIDGLIPDAEGRLKTVTVRRREAGRRWGSRRAFETGS